VVVLKKRVAGLSETALVRFVARARQAVGLKGAVDILVTSDTELRSLNRRFREQDKTTDVLSFPGEPGTAKDFAGDIAISAEIASRNASELGHPLASEIKILILHGLLHLGGYDHEQDQGQMAAIEQRLRRKLRLPIGLIERTNSHGRKSPPNGAARRRRS
jgi:probable rRNA maturation factor